MLDKALRQISQTSEEDFRPYDRYGDPVDGMLWIPLSGEANGGEFECFLLRMEPGATSRPHEHTGHEEFLMLEGSLIDDDGREFKAGDYVHFQPGSQHSSTTPNGCKLLVILRNGNNRALADDEIQK